MTRARVIGLAAVVPLLWAAGCVDVAPEPAPAEARRALDRPDRDLAPYEIDVVTAASEVGDLWVNIADPLDGDVRDPGFIVYVATGPGSIVRSVELWIDGELYASKTTAPYNFPTDRSLAGAVHVLQARSTDGSVVADHSVTVTVTGSPDDPYPDAAPGPDPTPGPDAGADPDPSPSPDPNPNPNPISSGVPGACAIAVGAEPRSDMIPLLLLALVALRARRR